MSTQNFPEIIYVHSTYPANRSVKQFFQSGVTGHCLAVMWQFFNDLRFIAD